MLRGYFLCARKRYDDGNKEASHECVEICYTAYR